MFFYLELMGDSVKSSFKILSCISVHISCYFTSKYKIASEYMLEQILKFATDLSKLLKKLIEIKCIALIRLIFELLECISKLPIFVDQLCAEKSIFSTLKQKMALFIEDKGIQYNAIKIHMNLKKNSIEEEGLACDAEAESQNTDWCKLIVHICSLIAIKGI